MRPEALNFIVCPNCAGELSLSSGATPPADDGHIMAGALACRGCASPFAIRNGVPILLPANLASVKLETASRFAEEWTRWSDLRDYYEQEFFDWVAPLTAADFANQMVFEGGCGKGRHTAIVASRGAKAIVSLDLGESAFVAFAHTRQLPNAHVVIGDLLNPPVRAIFDLAFSVGVLHHLPDPAAGFASLASRVREGGRVAFWVYGREGNEWITRYVDPVRKAITSKLPAPFLRIAAIPPAAVLWAVIKLFYRPRANGRGSAGTAGRGLRPFAETRQPLPISMPNSKFSGHRRCASARATATIEARRFCILPFSLIGSPGPGKALPVCAAQHFQPALQDVAVSNGTQFSRSSLR